MNTVSKSKRRVPSWEGMIDNDLSAKLKHNDYLQRLLAFTSGHDFASAVDFWRPAEREYAIINTCATRCY